MLETGKYLLLRRVEIVKFICTTKSLSQALALATRAVPSRPSHQILTNILVEADKSGQVTLTAFDLAIGIRATFQAEVSQSGSLALPAKILGDIASRLPSDSEVSLENLGDNQQILLKCNKSKFKLTWIDPFDYPQLQLPQTENQESIILTANILTRGLRGTLFAASTDETKQVLQGVNFAITEQEELYFAATDGHRLSVVEVALDGLRPNNLTIPARALWELLNILSRVEPEDLVKIYITEELVNFQVSGYLLTTRVIGGEYPKYNSLVPKEFATTAVVQRADLLASINRVAVLADQKAHHIVKFTFSDGELAIAAENSEFGNGLELLSAQFVGPAITLGFNYKYLIDGLKSFTSTDVLIKMNSPTSPVIFEPLAGANTYLTMPIQLRD